MARAFLEERADQRLLNQVLNFQPEDEMLLAFGVDLSGRNLSSSISRVVFVVQEVLSSF